MERVSEDGAKHYLFLSIDDPTWPIKLNYTLSQTGAEEGHTLYWSREAQNRRTS